MDKTADVALQAITDVRRDAALLPGVMRKVLVPIQEVVIMEINIKEIGVAILIVQLVIFSVADHNAVRNVTPVVDALLLHAPRHTMIHAEPEAMID